MQNKNTQLSTRRSRLPSSFFPFPSSLVLSVFGDIKNPLGNQFAGAAPYASVQEGLPLFLSNAVRIVTLGGGIWMFFNLLTAGLMYITSNGEAEKITKAWAMIYQSLIGLLIIVAAFAITGIMSLILFGKAETILNPVIYGPGTP